MNNNKHYSYSYSRQLQRFIEVHVYHQYDSLLASVVVEDNYQPIYTFESLIELQMYLETFELGIRIAKRLHPKANKRTLMLKAYEYGKQVQLANYTTSLNPTLTVGGNQERYRMLKVKAQKDSSIYRKSSYEDNRTFDSRFGLVSTYVFNAHQRKATINRLLNR